MKFTHKIRIDTDFYPDLQGKTLSVDTLWQGLIWRAKSPQDFLEHLDQVRILQENEQMLRRELHFGQLRIIDQIEFDHAQKILRQHSKASSEHHGGQLEIRCIFPEDAPNCPPEIEFSYQNDLPENSDEEKYYANYLKQMYQMLDSAAVQKIIAAALNAEAF